MSYKLFVGVLGLPIYAVAQLVFSLLRFNNSTFPQLDLFNIAVHATVLVLYTLTFIFTDRIGSIFQSPLHIIWYFCYIINSIFRLYFYIYINPVLLVAMTICDLLIVISINDVILADIHYLKHRNYQYGQLL